MKKIAALTAIVLLSLLIFSRCAKVGSISGGPLDSIPPVLVSASPKNFSTNFNSQVIKISFSEYVKFKDVSKQLVVSPPLKQQPTVTPTVAAKEFTIRFRDTLKPNTTYCLNFGNSIQDNNEGISLENFRYVFSTGSTIDSLTLEGRVSDALERKLDPGISLLLYDANDSYNDSLVYKQAPRYVTTTRDSLNNFKFEYLKAGSYKLIALQEKTVNYKLEPASEKIGFSSTFIQVPNTESQQVRVSKAKSTFKALNASSASANRLLIGYSGTADQVQAEILFPKTDLKPVVTKIPGKDSLHVFIPQGKKDSIGVRIRSGAYQKDFTVKSKLQASDSLTISAVKAGALPWREDFELLSSTPIARINKELISLTQNGKPIDFSLTEDLAHLKTTVKFKKEEVAKYVLQILPKAVQDIYGQENDSLKFSFGTRALSEFGNLTLSLKNAPKSPLLLQLTNDKGKVLYESVVSESQQVFFEGLEPNKFYVRVIVDTNGNGMFDSGNILENKQPEEVIYFPELLDVRANWDVNQDFDLRR
ncbi:Ig-like domain-containing protein [Flavobacterium sp.]|uniref:Ig-like domain-containing protein n=1 Tax=Flavobacterium sp. TaxID=239 RepID=UPI002603A05B|nr:Ig-like domain-containing protein [Flavobacterium sp.]